MLTWAERRSVVCTGMLPLTQRIRLQRLSPATPRRISLLRAPLSPQNGGRVADRLRLHCTCHLSRLLSRRTAGLPPLPHLCLPLAPLFGFTRAPREHACTRHAWLAGAPPHSLRAKHSLPLLAISSPLIAQSGRAYYLPLSGRNHSPHPHYILAPLIHFSPSTPSFREYQLGLPHGIFARHTQ